MGINVPIFDKNAKTKGNEMSSVLKQLINEVSRAVSRYNFTYSQIVDFARELHPFVVNTLE